MKGEYRQKTLPVDSFEPNPWGLYQVHGNIYEWVEDCWHPNYEGAPNDGSAWATPDCERRVLRGGAWNFASWHLRSASRG
jgi:formylglycine-generating enzyme required for sulfatase activity